MNTSHLAALIFTLLIVGCAGTKTADPPKSTTTSIRRGRDFDSSKVRDIQKGKTTTQEVVQWFGEPFAKKVVSTNEVAWLYAWKQSTVTVNRSTYGSKGTESGVQKRLELLISNDVIMNFTFNEGPFETDGTRTLK